MMLFCSDLLLRLMGFAYNAALIRCVPASALGLESLLMQVYRSVAAFCIYGLNTVLAAVSAKLDESEIPSLFIAALTAFAVLFAAAAFPVALFSKQLSAYVIGDALTYKAVLLLLFCIFLTGIENVLKSIHLGTGRVKQCAVSELCEQGARYFLVILLLGNRTVREDAECVFLITLGMVISELVSVSFLIFSLKKCFIGRKKLGSIGRFPAMTILKAAFPAVLTAVSSTLFSSAGTLILPHCLSTYGMERNEALQLIGEVNSVAAPAAMLPLTFSGALAAVLAPEVSRLNAVGEDDSRIIKRSLALTASVGAAACAAVFLLSDRLTFLLFGRAVDTSIMALLIIKTYALCFSVVLCAKLNGWMQQRTVFSITIFAEVFELIMILLLVPIIGIAGQIAGVIAGEVIKVICFAMTDNKVSKSYGICIPDMLQSNQ